MTGILLYAAISTTMVGYAVVYCGVFGVENIGNASRQRETTLMHLLRLPF